MNFLKGKFLGFWHCKYGINLFPNRGILIQCMRYLSNDGIIKLCDKYEFEEAIQATDKLINLQKIPDNHTLYQFLKQCKIKNNIEMAEKIWKKLVNDNYIKPNIDCFTLFIDLISRQNKNKSFSYKLIKQLMNEKKYDLNNLTQYQWYVMINTYSHFGDIEKMMKSYFKMRENKKILLNRFLIYSICEGLIHNKQCRKYSLIIYNDIKNDLMLNKNKKKKLLICVHLNHCYYV